MRERARRRVAKSENKKLKRALVCVHVCTHYNTLQRTATHCNALRVCRNPTRYSEFFNDLRTSHLRILLYIYVCVCVDLYSSCAFDGTVQYVGVLQCVAMCCSVFCVEACIMVLHIRVYMYMYEYAYVHICIYMYIYMHIYIYVYIFIYTYLYTYTYVYVCMYIYTYVCECMFTCIYIRIGLVCSSRGAEDAG